jgi:GT2 family glycosyltransferase
MTQLAVSIVVYRTAMPTLSWALAGLAHQEQPPDVVMLHLNDSSKALADELQSTATTLLPSSRVFVTWSTENEGFCLPHNRLMKAAFAEGAWAVLVHNPDLRLAPNALRCLAKAADELRGDGLFGPVLELADPHCLTGTGLLDTAGITWRSGARHFDEGQGGALPHPGRGVEPIAGVSGACLLVTARCFRRIVSVSGEFFDEQFFAYREDAELSFRAALLDIRSWVVLGATGLHVRTLRAGVRGESPLVDMLGVRNRFLLAAKYGWSRPGGAVRPLARDLVVLGGVLLRERSSATGLLEAWRLRNVMRVKGQSVLAQAVVSSRAATSRHTL